MNRFLAIALALLALSACSSTPAATPAPTPTPSGPPRVTIGMNDFRDIQYAPFLVADKKGYFTQEGLSLFLGWEVPPDPVQLVWAGQIDFALASGDRVIEARSQGHPIVFIDNLFGDVPIEIVSLKSKNITTPRDLVGKKVGLRSLAGPEYSAYLLLLANQKIDPASVKPVAIGLTAVKQLPTGDVDAIVVYANANPAQLKPSGQEINEIKVWDYVHYPGLGLITNESDIQNKSDLLRRVVRALTKGLNDTLTNPNEALQLSTQAMPVLLQPDPQVTTNKFAASVALWKRSTLGPTKAEEWQALAGLMRQAGLIKQDVDASKAFTNEFVQ